jgi:hypothetical protein
MQNSFFQGTLNQIVVQWQSKANHIMPMFLRMSQSVTAGMRYAESKFSVAAGFPALIVITSIASCPMEQGR